MTIEGTLMARLMEIYPQSSRLMRSLMVWTSGLIRGDLALSFMKRQLFLWKYLERLRQSGHQAS